MAKLPPTYRGRPVTMPSPPPPGNVLFGRSIPNNGKAVARQHAAKLSGTDRGVPVTSPKLPPAPKAVRHVSEPLRADIQKLGSEKAARVRAVADRK